MATIEELQVEATAEIEENLLLNLLMVLCLNFLMKIMNKL